ncbi:PQQ-binding-like beta-propeller repeat protein [Sphingomonas sp. MS122]|uniref:outer membrane protein assembly factor BamB family protein n=1 Tax=Sphingomonas sp. MS122 TaxID=3412683 RepID=UPI003C2B090A
MALDPKTVRISAVAAILSLTACANSAYPVSHKGGAGAYGAGWPAVHADAGNSDYHSGQGAADLTPAWSRTFDGMINLGPTSDGTGRLFITTSGAGCRLHALDRATGRSIWCSDVVDRLAVASSPLIDSSGNLYLGDGTKMRAFDRNGRVRWQKAIIGVPLSAQFTPRGDLLFITHVGVIYVLDRLTGQPIVEPHALVKAPSFDPADGMVACMRGLAQCPSANTPAMDARSGRFYFTFWAPGADRSGVRAMRIAHGPRPRLIDEWMNEGLPGGSASSPDLSADGKRLYLTDNEGSLHALDAATGNILWSVPIGYQAGGSVSLSPEGLILPAGGRAAGLMAIRDRGDRGEIIWRKPDLQNFGVATQAAGFLAYPTIKTGSGTADLIVVDTRTGAELDREPIPGKPYFTVGTTIDQDGTVYVPTIRGTLHAFRPAAFR